MDHDSMTTDNFETLYADCDRRVLAYKRWNEAGEVVVVAINFDAGNEQPLEITGKALASGDWTDLLSGENHTVKEDRLNLTLPPNSACVLYQKTD
jgi:hypothetical protein